MRNTNIHQLRKNSRRAAEMLKALAHPERLMILCQLVAGEKTVGELWQGSDLSQSAFSQHLAVLRRKKLVTIRKEAQTIFYTLANQDSIKILELLHRIYCQ
ncbi:MAG: helix-turn-helix transcriptional regulator [Legionellales bacterium]|nr:helix-turn-helix transcriptional regulator [Legionellales bacterium]